MSFRRPGHFHLLFSRAIQELVRRPFGGSAHSRTCREVGRKGSPQIVLVHADEVWNKRLLTKGKSEGNRNRGNVNREQQTGTDRNRSFLPVMRERERKKKKEASHSSFVIRLRPLWWLSLWEVATQTAHLQGMVLRKSTSLQRSAPYPMGPVRPEQKKSQGCLTSAFGWPCHPHKSSLVNFPGLLQAIQGGTGGGNFEGFGEPQKTMGGPKL